VCYDSEDDVIIGPHKNFQLVMIRGLVANWKQPIYYNLDKIMTKELLFEIVLESENAGYCCCDRESDDFDVYF